MHHEVYRQFGRICALRKAGGEYGEIPADYYRCSAQTFREVFFEGLNDIEVFAILAPPQIIGAARKP